MAVFKVHMRQRRGAMAEFEFEQHAQTDDEARTMAQDKFPVHDVVSVRRLDTPNHEKHVQVAAALLEMARYHGSLQGRAASFLAKPISEMAVNVKEAVERRVRAGDTSVDSIARAIFNQLIGN